MQIHRERLAQLATPITQMIPTTRTVRCSASQPHLVEAALDLAAGTIPAHGWIIDSENTAYLGLVGFHSRKAVILCFPSPQADEFLVEIAKHRTLTLAVEGCIPATVSLAPKAHDALSAYMEERGWMP